jgi:hypothetical protein
MHVIVSYCYFSVYMVLYAASLSVTLMRVHIVIITITIMISYAMVVNRWNIHTL